MGRRTLLLLAAILIAAVGTGMILLYVNGISQRAAEGQKLTEILVATETINAGETAAEALAAGKIVSRDVRTVDVASGAVSSINDFEDLQALQTVFPDQQILRAQFGSLGVAPQLDVPDQKIAISLDLTNPERVAGFVEAGSTVAVFVTFEDAGKAPPNAANFTGPYTQLIATDVPVLGTGTTGLQPPSDGEAEGSNNADTVPSTVLTMAVTQDEAERIIYADRWGDVNVALLSENSETNTQEFGAVMSDVIPEYYEEY
jgi:pilus assembly protein CpaB